MYGVPCGCVRKGTFQKQTITPGTPNVAVHGRNVAFVGIAVFPEKPMLSGGFCCYSICANPELHLLRNIAGTYSWFVR
jgi:hypothetical protein